MAVVGRMVLVCVNVARMKGRVSDGSLLASYWAAGAAAAGAAGWAGVVAGSVGFCGMSAVAPTG